MPRLVLSLVLAALTGGCIALSHCTEMGCMGSYSLSFEADGWEDGEYALDVFFDELVATDCAFTLPLAEQVNCEGATVVALEDGVLSVRVSTPMNEDLFEADISLTQGETVLLEEVVEPAWGEPYWPNGEACDRGYGCLSATESFSL